ncbi:ATP-binding cassette domain-containing protein [Micavibrio aeruginosavorus]|uniref:ATP-binding cassette domain-containing protein n=1 Tax=Micavibrio aeruginosavorus TaxID=349221 RepID=UPI003F4AD18B
MAKAFDEFYKSTGPIAHNDVPFIVVTESQDDCPDIRAYDLTVRTPGDNPRVLLQGVNLHFKPGDRVIFTGESGSGKTTAVKALMNSWDYGQGLVVMPRNVKTMLFSQAAYAPNANLRTILNMATEGNEKFTDRELRHALQTVGLNKLVEQIPGQQIEILIDEMTDHLKNTSYLKKDVGQVAVDFVQRRIPELFSSVQSVPDKQRNYLCQSLRALVPEGDFDNVFHRVVDAMDNALMAPLQKRLALFAADIATRKRGKIYAYTPAKIKYFAWSLRRSLNKAVKSYMANDDTDDAFREIRLNEYQARRVVDTIVNHTRDEMMRQASSGPMHQVFNAASWPLSLAAVRMKARSAVNEIVQAVTFFMEKQVMTGDTMSLSGGERQKLMIAIATLHQPDILFLDEITAALDKETGAALYKDMLDHLPKHTIVLSIAHNTHIMPYHNLHAHLENQGITVRRIAQQAPGVTPTPSV